MKKHTLVLFLALLFGAAQTKAQEVYNIVLENATRVVNNPTSTYTQTKIAQFKRTALVYLKSKSFEASDTVSAELLNTQAYYLSEFLTLFVDQLIKSKSASSDAQCEKMSLFMSASESNPLFNDPDKETTLSFVNAKGEFTPFSLDTDWQKAYFAVKSRL